MGARTQTQSVTNSIPPPPPGFEPETPTAAPAGFVPEGNLPAVPATATSLPGSTQRLRDSVNNGELTHSFTEPTQFERDRPGKGVTWDGVGKGALDAIGGMAKGLGNTVKTLLTPNPDADTLDLDPRSAAAHRATTQGPGAFDQLGREDAARKDAGYGLAYRAAAPIAENTGIASPQSAEAHAASGEGGAIIGENLPGLAGAVLGLRSAFSEPVAAVTARPSVPVYGLKNNIASMLRDPATARQSKLGKPGTVTDILPPQAQKWVLPSWAVPKGDLGTATNPGQFMEIPAKMPKPPKPEFTPLTESPNFVINKEKALSGQSVPLTQSPNLQNYRAVAADREAVPMSQSPNLNINKAKLAGQPPPILPADAAPFSPFPPVPGSNGNGLHGNPTPFAGPNQALILPAEEPVRAGSEGTAARWRNEDVARLSRTGNRDAITQKIRRGIPLAENERLVMGDADMGRAVLNPRSVTKFTPDGQPIENLADPRIGAAPSPILPPVPNSNVGAPPASSTMLATPPSAGSPVPPLLQAPGRFPEPTQPMSPQELNDLSHQAGRPLTPIEAHQFRVDQDKLRNVQTALGGNRQDLAGNIRELHRATLEQPKIR